MACRGCRVPERGEQQRVARIGGEGLEVMQYAPAGGHAAGRKDDHRPDLPRRGHGILRLFDKGRNVARRSGFLGRQAMSVAVFLEYSGGTGGHGTVQIDRQAGNCVGLPQFVEQLQQDLCPSHGEGRDHQNPACPGDLVHHVRQNMSGVFLGMVAVSLGRHHYQVVGVFQYFRWMHYRIIRPADIATEGDGVSVTTDADGAGPQQVAHRCEADLERPDLFGFPSGDWSEQVEAVHGASRANSGWAG